MTILYHDYETFSRLDIKKVGGYRYAADPSTEVLMCAWAFNDGPVRHWDATTGAPMPRELAEALVDPNIKKSAFNATFEFLIARDVLKLPVKIGEFYCTMAHAWSLSFSGGLDDVGSQMGIPQDKAKMKEGKLLIQRFSKPAPANHKADRYDRHSHPEEWQRFCEYNCQDVIAEREIHALLAPYPIIESERQLWLLDAEINQRGVPIDIDLVDRALEVSKIEKKILLEKMVDLTHLPNPNSRDQMMAWLNERGAELEDMKKDTLAAKLKELPEGEMRTAIELRQQASKTSTAKWSKAREVAMADNRVRGMFAFGGAQRTQRWGGRLIQLQNLPSGNLEDPRWVADMMLMLGHGFLAEYFAPVMDALSSTIRCAIKAPKGHKLVVPDLAGIESRVLGYLAGCKKINAIFAEGRDVYKSFAVEALHKPYEEVTKEERKFYKAPSLGGGFGMGWKGLIAYAEGFGVSMSEEEARHCIDTFRGSYPEVPAMWKWLVESCTEVIQYSVERSGYGVRIFRDHNFMFIELPSGRRISYFKPLIIQKAPPWELDKQKEEAAEGRDYVPRLRPVVSYMGMDQYTNKWKRISTTPGKICENCLSGDTEVLTDSGWKRIRDYVRGDRLWDGVEWVNGGRLIDSGIQTVINCWGANVTPDHRILTQSGWATAQEIVDAESTENRYYREEVHPPGDTLSRKNSKETNLHCEMRLRKDVCSYRVGDDEIEGAELPELRMHEERLDREKEHYPRHGSHSAILCMEIDDRQMPPPYPSSLRSLWWAWDSSVRKVARSFYEFLGRYGPYLSARTDLRPPRQQRRLHARELPLGLSEGTSEQYASECFFRDPLGTNDGKAGSRKIGDRSYNSPLPYSPPLADRKTVHKTECDKQDRVYDIANVGPRNRFTVRGQDGRSFIVHNCVQAVARDILAVWMHRIAKRYDIVLHVHDEVGVVVPDDQADEALDYMIQASREPIPWAPTLLLDAAGYVSQRYYKD